MTASLDDARVVLDAGSKLLAEAVAAAKTLTADGKNIDDHQVATERVAYAATEAVAAHEMLAEYEAWFADVSSSGFEPPRIHIGDAREPTVVLTHQDWREPEEDGVACALTDAGFVCAYDVSGAGTPAFTHWTSTTVDFAWCHFQDAAKWRVLRSQVLPTALSDHLPIVTDLLWEGA